MRDKRERWPRKNEKIFFCTSFLFTSLPLSPISYSTSNFQFPFPIPLTQPHAALSHFHTHTALTHIHIYTHNISHFVLPSKYPQVTQLPFLSLPRFPLYKKKKDTHIHAPFYFVCCVSACTSFPSLPRISSRIISYLPLHLKKTHTLQPSSLSFLHWHSPWISIFTLALCSQSSRAKSNPKPNQSQTIQRYQTWLRGPRKIGGSPISLTSSHEKKKLSGTLASSQKVKKKKTQKTSLSIVHNAIAIHLHDSHPYYTKARARVQGSCSFELFHVHIIHIPMNASRYHKRSTSTEGCDQSLKQSGQSVDQCQSVQMGYLCYFIASLLSSTPGGWICEGVYMWDEQRSRLRHRSLFAHCQLYASSSRCKWLTTAVPCGLRTTTEGTEGTAEEEGGDKGE